MATNQSTRKASGMVAQSGPEMVSIRLLADSHGFGNCYIRLCRTSTS